MKIKKLQSVCLILACVAVTGLIGCGETDEMPKKHEAITFMAPYLEVDSFIEEVQLNGNKRRRRMQKEKSYRNLILGYCMTGIAILLVFFFLYHTYIQDIIYEERLNQMEEITRQISQNQLR